MVFAPYGVAVPVPLCASCTLFQPAATLVPVTCASTVSQNPGVLVGNAGLAVIAIEVLLRVVVLMSVADVNTTNGLPDAVVPLNAAPCRPAE